MDDTCMERLHSTEKVAEALVLSAETVRKCRVRGHGGPKYRRVGDSVRYAESDLNELLLDALVERATVASAVR